MKNFFLISVLLLIHNILLANRFTVTSNMDSGAGTFRESLTLAALNGNSEKDTIEFNFADTARNARTIILLNELPSLSSNLVIDGTTQAGNPFGMSDAKIILLFSTVQKSPFTFLKFESESDVEIYGLFLFYDKFTLFTPSVSGAVVGINFTNSKNIVIGKPGKGNYFRGLYSAIYSLGANQALLNSPNSKDVSIQSNIFNNDENGNPTIYYLNNNHLINPMNYAINFWNVKNIQIGGKNAREGNTISANEILIESYKKTDNGYLNFHGNNIGTDYKGNYVDFDFYARTNINISGESHQNPADYVLDITNNVISGNVGVNHLSVFLTVKNNIFFDNYGGASVNRETKLKIFDCSNVVLLGESRKRTEMCFFQDSI